MDSKVRRSRRRQDAVTRILGAASIVVSLMIAGLWFVPDHGGSLNIVMPAAVFFWLGQRMMRNRLGLFG